MKKEITKEWEKEWEKVMGCIDECKNGMYEDVGCPAHGYDAIKAVKFFRDVLKHQIASAVEARENKIGEHILAIGHNDECMFCGFKDKFATSIINPSKE